MGVVFFSGAGPSFRIGRDPANDLVLDGSFVSRRHLCLVFVTCDVAIAEVAGMNGAVIEGKQVNRGGRVYVRAGDLIRIGSYDMVWTGKALPEVKGFIRSVDRREELQPEAVEIEGPPARRAPEKPSVMLAAGPALTMAIPILLGAGRTVAVLSSVFAAGWAAFNVFGRIRRVRSEERRRRNAYMSYLQSCEELIKQKMREVRSGYLRRYPAVADHLKGGGNLFLLWRGQAEDTDIPVRVGIGTIANPVDIVIPKDRFAAIDDSLKELPALIREKFGKIPQAPVIYKISDKTVTVVVTGDEKGRMTLSSVILQLAVSYPPDRLRITTDLSDDMRRTYAWVRWLPHFTDQEDDKGDEAEKRVLITDNIRTAYESQSCGSRVILAVSGTDDVPDGVCSVINSRNKPREIRYDMIPEALCYSYTRSLSRMWGNDTKNKEMPANVPFGRLICDEGFKGYDGDPEMLSRQITKNWAGCDITQRFDAPIGIGESEKPVILDLHEKASGPHGVIAGTTGSGKSELLTTIILSFASRFPPDKLSFFLIDYKGGGMSNLFEKLPHLSGSVSNLTKAGSHRAMISLKRENTRRQEIFAKYKVNNINDYTGLYDSGEAKEPLPHILIIIDEFAELRKEEPDLMDGLISVSRVGRSLGIHLILATQKPAGVVDEKIRGNSRFRIALRLVDRSDSMDMIQRSDAAFIRECGRAYLQVGNDEVFECFQSGYAMGPAKDTSNPVLFYEDPLLESGISTCTATDEEPDTEVRTWYELVMEAIDLAVKRTGVRKSAKLALPPLPENVTDESAYAVFDNPYMQRYERAIYDPKMTGNVLIAGRSGTGKSELIHTMLSRVAGQYAVYITDHGGGRLECMKKYPFCGGYVPAEQTEDIARMTGYISGIITKRRKTHEIPYGIILVLDDQTGILASDTDVVNDIKNILSVGKSAGVYVIASCLSTISARFADMYDTRLCMGVGDVYETAGFLRVSAGSVPVIPERCGSGTGLIDGIPLEFRTVIVKDDDRPPPGGISAPPYPHIPPNPSLEDLLRRASYENKTDVSKLNNGSEYLSLPVGYEIKSGRLFMLPAERIRCILVSGKPYSGRHTFLSNISITAARYGISCVRADSYEALMSLCKDPKGAKIITIESIMGILAGFYEKDRSIGEEEELTACLVNPYPPAHAKGRGHIIVGIIENDVRTRFAGRRVYESMTDHPYAITFGGCLDENRIFDYSYLPFSVMHETKKRCTGTVLRFDDRTWSGDIIIPGTINVDNSQSL